MDAKRILPTPLLWILVLISALVFGMMFSESGPPRIDTSAAMSQIAAGNVESAKLVNNERMELTLKTPYNSPDGTVKDAKSVYAYYVEARGTDVVKALNAKPATKGVDDQIDEPSWFGSLLFSILPIIIILGLFWFLMGQMQGGGNRVMQFGKAGAKLGTKDPPQGDVRRRRRLRRGHRGAPGDQGVPPGAGEVPRRRRQDPQGRAALRPARYRQDPAGPGRRG